MFHDLRETLEDVSEALPLPSSALVSVAFFFQPDDVTDVDRWCFSFWVL